MKKTITILGTVALLSVGCTQALDVDYVKPMHVSSAKYQKITCKELKERFSYKKELSCKEIKEKHVYISPTEYEKLSCKQLNNQLIKINERLDEKSMDASDYVLFGAGSYLYIVSCIFIVDVLDSMDDTNVKRVPENEILKEAYKTLKDSATKKNCSFVENMR